MVGCFRALTHLGPGPVSFFRERLLVAEEKAGLEHLKGGAWHPFRRKWAPERKDLPPVDVKATGGWRDQHASHVLPADR